jgi:hypothetical protein
MKPAQKSAVSYVVKNEKYAMKASTPRWLGYTTLNSIPCMVDAVTAHSEDLDWSDINDFNDIIEVVQYLGRATG